MKVKVSLSVDDYWNFDKFMVLNSPKLRWKLLLSLGSMPATIIVLGIVLKLPVYYIVPLTVVVGLAFDILYLNLSKKRFEKKLQNNEGYLGEHTFEIGDEGIKETTCKRSKFNKWTSIKHVTENIEYIYIFFEQTMAHIIPKKAFSSETEAREFFKSSLDLWISNEK